MSTLHEQRRSTKSRPYRMRRRAEQVDQTRLRITEAAVRLHTTVGPSHTSIAAVAEEAGVTRLTVYRHFADLDAVFVACMAHWSARNPRPDTAAWTAIPNLERRARRAFGELYGWYRDHADELYPINRDAAAMPLSAQRAREAGNQSAGGRAHRRARRRGLRPPRGRTAPPRGRAPPGRLLDVALARDAAGSRRRRGGRGRGHAAHSHRRRHPAAR